MEFNQLRTFLVIARLGNLTRAAAELHASQPAISGQLKALEEELGVALFFRTPRGMTLSEAGERLRDKAQEICDLAAEFADLAASLGTDAPLRCRLGLNTTATALRIPQLVAYVAERAPQLRLELHQGQTQTTLDGIARGALDAGFFFGPCEQVGLACTRLAEVELAMVGPSAWKPSLDHAPWDALLAKSWVLPPTSCPFHAKTRELLRPIGQWPIDHVTADDEATMLDLVRSEAGVALLPASMAEEQPGVTVLRETQARIELGFAWQATRSAAAQLNPVRQALALIWGAASPAP